MIFIDDDGHVVFLLIIITWSWVYIIITPLISVNGDVNLLVMDKKYFENINRPKGGIEPL